MMEKKIKLTPDSLQSLAVLAALVIVCVIGIILEPTLFFTVSNFTNMLVSASSIIIVASAVTLVIISGNLNLSVGGLSAMGAVSFALMAKSGIPVFAAAALAICLGVVMGSLTGFIISWFNLPSFIVSLAFDYISRGIALIGAGGAVVFGLPAAVGSIGATINGIPLCAVYAVLIVGVFIWFQNKTVFAAKTYAIGSNETTSLLSGISRKQVVTIVFALSGALAAFVGIVITSRFNAADSGISSSLSNDCIIAAVLGGTDINGGRGTVVSMLIGAFFITVLTNIMNMQGMTVYTQNVVRGVVLVLAICLNNVIRSKVKL